MIIVRCLFLSSCPSTAMNNDYVMVIRNLLSQMQFLQEQMPEKVRKLVRQRSCRALLRYNPCTIPLPCLSELRCTVPNGWVQRVTHFILQAMGMALHSISLCGCCCLLLPALVAPFVLDPILYKSSYFKTYLLAMHS